MDIYNAIMRAADHIERDHSRHSFVKPAVPKRIDERGCPLAWIGYFGQPMVSEEHWYKREAVAAKGVSQLLLGVDESVFFSRMAHLQRWYHFGKSWKNSASVAVGCLRRYAAKYHAPVVPPDWNAIASRQTIGEHERSQELA